MSTIGTALTKCFYCGDDSVIIMNTRLTEGYAKKVKELHGKVVSMEPCSKCQEYMKQGIIVIVYDPTKTDDIKTPYRTGHFAVVKQEAVERWYDNQEELNKVLKHRFVFMEDTIAKQIGIMSV